MTEPGSRPPSLFSQPAYLASQVSKYGRRQLEAVLRGEHDLALIHHGLLRALDDFGPASQQHLGDALDIDKSHLVGSIDQLQARGLVERTQDPTDRRRNQIALTAAGKALIDRLRPVAERSQEAFLATLSESERKT